MTLLSGMKGYRYMKTKTLATSGALLFMTASAVLLFIGCCLLAMGLADCVALLQGRDP